MIVFISFSLCGSQEGPCNPIYILQMFDAGEGRLVHVGLIQLLSIKVAFEISDTVMKGH